MSTCGPELLQAIPPPQKSEQRSWPRATAADAVVAMCLASCVAETVYSGLLAGCHAVVFDGARVRNLDGFAAVPSEEGDLTEIPVGFGEEVVVYSIGAASCAVPGARCARRALGAARPAPVEAAGRARARSRTCRRPAPRDARTLADHARRRLLARARGELFVREGRMLQTGELLVQPGLVQTLEALAEEARRASIAARWPKRSCVSTAWCSQPTTSGATPLVGQTPCSSASTSTAWPREAVCPGARAPAPAASRACRRPIASSSW